MKCDASDIVLQTLVWTHGNFTEHSECQIYVFEKPRYTMECQGQYKFLSKFCKLILVQDFSNSSVWLNI